MVRETRHLWVGNLPDSIREDRIREHFKRYGRVQNVKLLGRTESGSTSATANGTPNSGVCATVAFMDIKSASKAHNAEHVLDERTLTTEYYEPAAIPSSAGAPSAGSSPAGSGYSGSSSSVNSTPAPSTVSRYHLSGGEESTGSACPLAATAAAPANWRGTNDSATEYCRRGNTPAAYSRYQRTNSNTPYSTPPSNVERTTPHHRWYAREERGGGGGGGESTPSTPGGGTEGGRRRRPSGSGSSRSESSSPEPSDTSRASTPHAPPPPPPHHANHRAPSTPSHHHQWSSTASGRPLAICVRNLPTRSTDTSLKDGLYHEYKKHGKVVWVKVVGQNADRYAVVRFKKPSDVEKALEVSQDKLFFGCKISVAAHQSCDEDADSAKPYETDIDEYHPKATRTLFIGNLEKDVTQQQLREKFKHYGRIIEIDIKKGSGGGAGYAFCQYASISSVVEAIRAMDGEYVGGSRVKLGFGKPVATTCVWVDGLTEHTEKQVLGAISRCGAATSVCVDRAAGSALVHFEQAAAAGTAVRELRRVAASASAAALAAGAAPEHDPKRLCVDYASRECQEAFYEQLDKKGNAVTLNGLDRLGGDMSTRFVTTTSRHDPLRYDGCTSRSRAPSYGRSSSRTPRYPSIDPYDPADYPAERRYRVYDELGSSPQTEDTPFEERLQSVVVSPHRARRHRRDSSPEDRKHSKERHRSVGGSTTGCSVTASGRRSRSGSRGGERHGGRRRHRRRRDGSGSRAGTPLRDEPDAPPAEPRRPPRDRPPLPMSLPLPKFAVQLLRAAPPASRPTPQPAPAPDSPPRPPSVSSSSGGSAPHSPSLEERIRSLDEKYEKWSGSRALADAPDRARLRHRLLEVDINEVKPSGVVRLLLAKRSVFDEDSERLEGAVRAPSPSGSPRTRSTGAAPRVLRYPFPSHPPQPPPDSAAGPPEPELEHADRPIDPRLNRSDRALPTTDRSGKFNEIDFRLDSRVRPRTPSTDRSQPDLTEGKSPRTELEGDADPRQHSERRRRDSLHGICKPLPDGEIDVDASVSEMIDFDMRSKDKCKIPTSERRQSVGKNQENVTDKTAMNTSERKDVLNQNEGKPTEPNRYEDNNPPRVREVDVMLLKRIGDKRKSLEEFNIKSELRRKSIDEFNIKTELPRKSIEEFNIKTELPRKKSIEEFNAQSNLPAHIDEEIKLKLEGEIKLENFTSQTKNDSEKCKELFTQNQIKKENVELDPQVNNHLNSLNSVKTKDVFDSSAEYMKSNEKNGKDRFNQNVILDALHNTKLEKENIEFEKCFDKDKIITNNLFFGEKKLIDSEKNHDDRNRNDKSRHGKDRHDKDKQDNDKDKTKSNKYDKDKKLKEESSNDKVHTEKSEKSSRESDKSHKERNERDSERPKHPDEKSTRHDHHRKDKLEKDKRKDSTESDSKSKKEEKSKHDKKKDNTDSKRDNRKDSDFSKSRKSSRDESSRELSRKDSTDSSTSSRTSHESSKLKEIDINDVKEETKSKVKHHNDLCNKPEIDKDSSPKCFDFIKFESISKIKIENKEEKDSDQITKIKNDSTADHTVKIKAEVEKQRHYSLDSPSVESRRKERLNSCSSLPSNIGHKRRMSSQDSIDSFNEELKKSRAETKSIERRDSKDSRNNERHKTTKFNKGHFAKIIESKTKDDKKNQVKPPDEVYDLKDNETKEHKLNSDKQKNLKKSLDEDEKVHTELHNEGLHNDIDFLATLELRSSEEDEKQKALRKEMKEKKRIQQLQQIQQLQMQQDAMQQAELLNKLKEDKKLKTDEKKKEAARDKRLSTDRKSRDEKSDSIKQRKNRKQVQSTDSSDSDEPKKHSIFDIIDDGPTYISMYDKVKARSCKNMQKQEEEKRQEKIKAKFSQLKQSRAKREEKKRSSWDEDSDSEHDRKKTQKVSIDTSSDDENMVSQNKKREKMHSLEYDTNKINNYCSVPTTEEDLRNKLARKNSRTRIMSDTSDDETSKRSTSKSPIFIKKELTSDSETLYRENATHVKESFEDKIKKNSLLNLFGKSDSDDSKLKSGLEIESEYKALFNKTISNEFSSESESAMCNRISGEVRKKHKKKQKKHKMFPTDGENKIENDSINHEGETKHKVIEKVRRHSTKKEKRKDKIRESVDTDEPREEKSKPKREKKIPNNTFDLQADTVSKKDGKMEDIFGPLSDDSDKETKAPQLNKSEFSMLNFESPLHANEQNNCESNCDDGKFKERDDIKRRKDKKRKEKRYLIKEDDNSLDVDAVSKQIEARLFAEAIADDNNRTGLELPEYLKKLEETEGKKLDDLLSDSYKNDKHIEKVKKDCREKRKKKKKNRDDRQSRKDHHHYYNNDRLEKSEALLEKTIIDISSKDMLLDIPLPSDVPATSVPNKSDGCKSPSDSSSLPRLTDSPPITQNDTDGKHSDDSPVRPSSNISMDIDYPETKQVELDSIPMPPSIESIDISEVPLPEDPPKEPPPKLESFIASLDDDIEKSENAVRSIPNVIVETEKSPEKVESPPPSKVEKKVDEKPRAVISQEETADAVAALLGESFGGKVIFPDYEQSENESTHQTEIESAAIETEIIPEEDAEEMRRAVQNLNASEMEMKPDTPVSDSDLLLIDTDTEETEDTPPEVIERLPVNIIATEQSLNINTEQQKPINVSNTTKHKPAIVQVVTSQNNAVNVKVSEPDTKPTNNKRENVHQITSTATSVITPWSVTNNKLIEPHVVNIQTNPLVNRDKNENKPTHITANIIQIKPPQNMPINNAMRPIISPTRVSAPYQVINHMIRPPSNMQPPTIKIPEPHILYQKPPGIVISPRISNDPRLHSPKTPSQGEVITSPRLSNMTILSPSPQNLNSVGLGSPNALQQRSPGQVTVVRMQQPPLSPIQAMHMPHGARTMVSPNRPNSVLVQTQGAPIHFNRLPVAPVLAPISKQLNVSNVVQQNKPIGVSASSVVHQQKLMSTDSRKNDLRPMENINENCKVILSPTSLSQNTSPPVMGQNRLITMQHAVHVGSMNSNLHVTNKVLLNSLNQIHDKRENQIQKSEHLNHLPFGTTPIIHVAGINHSSSSIIHSGSKPVILQEPNIVRTQGSNVIHTLNSQRLLTTAPITNVSQTDPNKGPPSVLSMATIRPPSVLTKVDTTNSVAATTTCFTNVVMTPLLLKTTPNTVMLNSKNDKDTSESYSANINQISREREENNRDEKLEGKVPIFNYDSKEKTKDYYKTTSSVAEKPNSKTDFEELLKDTTNEIKVTNDPDKKLEINVGKTVTLIPTHHERKLSTDIKKEDTLDSSPICEKSVIDNNILPLQTEGQIQPNNPMDKEKRESVNIENSTNIGDLATESKPKKESITTDNANNDNARSVILNNILKLEEKTHDKINKSNDDNIFTLMSKDSESCDSQKTMDENDSWSAKDVNIDSVIKKVDSLCNEINDIREKREDGIVNTSKNTIEFDIANQIDSKSLTNKPSSQPEPTKPADVFNESSMETTSAEELSTPTPYKTTASKRGGRSARGKRADKNQDRVQTRQISKPARGMGSGKRGRGRAKVDKKIKSMVNTNINNIPGDVYDFHEDSGDESESPNKTETRPRLILTIKSPLSGHCATPTSTLSITQKENSKIAEKTGKEEKVEDFASPSANTRKSRRLQEKDVQKTTLDDNLDEFMRGPSKTGKRRPTRQAGAKVNQTLGTDTRKSPRGAKRTRDRSLSDTSMDSGDEKLLRREDGAKDAKVPKLGDASIGTKVVQEATPPVPAPAPALSAPTPIVFQSAAQPAVPQPIAHTTVVKPAHVQPLVNQPPTLTPTPVPTPTPIMKPPKKMISEISAKLAGAFEAATVSPVRMAMSQQPQVVQHAQAQQAQAEPAPEKLHLREPAQGAPATVETPPSDFRETLGDVSRRLVDNVPANMMPVGATEATDARVQSPALPHRPPSSHRPADRATPILMRGGDGEGVGAGAAGAAGVAGAGARFRGAYAGPASLPRGAHLPMAHPLKQVPVGVPHAPAGAASRVTLTSVPSISPQGQIGLSADLVRSPPPAHQQTSPVASGDGMYSHFSHQHYQVYQQHFRATQHEHRASPLPYTRNLEAEGCEAPTPPLELRRPASARVPRPAHSPAPSDRLIMYAVGCGRSPPPAHGTSRLPAALPPPAAPGPPHASQVPREADSLQMLLRRYPVMWQGLLALKNDSAAVQMHFVGGNHVVAGDTLPRLADGSTPLLRIAQRMRLEPTQLDQVHRKMKMENEHCILLALPCGRDHMDVLQQSTNLTAGFITYLQRKQAAGIVNVAPPGHQQALYTVHIFPSCDFANENLNRIAPDLMHRVADIAHLLIVIATV